MAEPPRWMDWPLSGPRYAAIGLGLGALKTLFDWQTARYFGHGYSLLFYVSPIDAPIMHPGGDRVYFAVLASATIPFVAIGVALTLRRLRDAAMSSWFALLFFAPFANLLFFLTMSLLPSRQASLSVAAPEEGVYREPGLPRVAPPPPPLRRYPRLVAGVSGAVVGLGAFALSVGAFREYGSALLVGTPTIAGFVTGAVLARLDPKAKTSGIVLAALLAETIMVLAVIAFAIEGLFCIWLIMPVFFVPTIIGALLGHFTGRAAPPARANTVVTAALLSFFALLGLDRISPLPPPILPEVVETTVDIDAPPDRVWALLPSIDTMPPPVQWGFLAGIAYPVRASMRGAGVGATRTCEFTTGPAIETIDLWEPGHALGFVIEDQPEPMRELTLYRTVRQPHNKGYVKSLRGEFALAPLPGGRTRLIGRSWYSLRLSPEAYWRAWCDVFVHQIHQRVLDVVKARAESTGGGLLVTR
jgi:hypothetical protein